MNSFGAVVAVCCLSLGCCITTKEYCSRVVDGPQISFEEGSKLKSKTVESGSRVELQCVVVSAPQARISWYHNGIPISVEDGAEMEIMDAERKTEIVGVGMLLARVLIPCAEPANAGEYECHAENLCGQTISSVANLQVLPKSGSDCGKGRREGVAPSIGLFTSSRIELASNAVQLLCRAHGSPPPSISWSIANEDETSFIPVHHMPAVSPLSNGDLLVISPPDDVASLTFRCTATNPHGVEHLDSSLVYLEPEEKS